MNQTTRILKKKRTRVDEVGPHPVDIMVGARVRAARISKGVSQTALANRLGLTFQQVQKYERGANRISASKLVDIARTLDVSAPEFLADLSDPGLEQSYAVFSTPGLVELALTYATLTPREQRILFRLARDMAGNLPDDPISED
jgi:transcriptional regulator with XRE-family HTH domain